MEKPWLQQSSEEQIKYIVENIEDVEFLVGIKDVEKPKSIIFFKQILSSVSPVFERMFNGDFKEAKSTDPVLIEDIYFKDFEQFLGFVKDQEAHVTKWRSLYCIAKKYLAEELIKSIMACLEIDKSPYKSLCLFEINHLEGKELKLTWNDGSAQYSEHFDMLVKIMETPLIHRLDPIVFLSLIKQLTNHQYKISQLKLFIAIDHYCARESNFSSISGKSYFEALYVKQLRFSGLYKSQFREFVEPSDLLDQQTKHKIVLKL